MNRWAWLLSLLVATGAGAAEFGRYQVILDRMPFGGVMGGASAATPNFATRFSFVGLVNPDVADGGWLAILADKNTPNRCYFKGVGEMVDDVKVVRIENKLPNRSVTLQRGLETATLLFEPRRATAAPAAPAVPGTPTAMTAAMPPPLPGGTDTPMPSSPRRIPFRR